MLNKNFYKSIISFLVLLLILSHGQLLMQEVKNALLICYNSVIPSLYIFMVFSTYVGQSDMLNILSVPLRIYSRLMKIQDRHYSGYLLLSMIGGFAVGADFLKKLADKGYPEKCICAIAPSMINNSLSFCVMAVGIGMLGNMWIGIMLFCSLSAAALITSFILSFRLEYNIITQIDMDPGKKTAGFVVSVTTGVRNILSICGFVIIFHCMCEVLSLYIDNTFIYTILCSVTEVTCGCLKTVENLGFNPYMMCIVLSLTPISTLCQVNYFTENFSVIKTLVISRIIHTPVSYMLFSVLMQLFPAAAAVSSSDSITVKAYQSSFEISATLFLITLAFIIISDSSRLLNKRTV